MKLHFEVSGVEAHKVLEAVQELERIDGHHIELISVVRLTERRPALVFFSDAKQIHPKGAHGGPIARI